MARGRNLFRVVYGSIYLLLYIILLGLLLITPADAIERSVRNGQHYNVWLLIFSYVATIVVVCFLYFVRLYINRTDLAAIPKAWIPIEAGDVKKRVHAMIVGELDRSAAISYEARPRVKGDGEVLGPDPIETHDLSILRPLQDALWRNIEHPGWASPNSPDLPNLNYATVLAELPNLIEAKVLTLAPRSHDLPIPDGATPILDPEAVALLQRASGLSLRGYIDHLAGLGVVEAGETAAGFLLQYEHARFSTRPISNAQFRELMRLFAEILRSMEPLDLTAALRDTSSTSSLNDFEDGASIDDSAPSITPRSNLSRSATQSTQNSVRRPLRSASLAQQYRTAPTTPRSRNVVSRKSSQTSSSSGNSFAQTRRQYEPSTFSSASSGGSRSVRSRGSSSVIRLATREDEEGMPYVLNLSGTVESF